MPSAKAHESDKTSPSESPTLSGSSQHLPNSSNGAAKRLDDNAAIYSQSQKLDNMQAEEIERIKKGYKEHEEKFGNRE